MRGSFWPSTQGEDGWWVVDSKPDLELDGKGQGQAACRGRYKHPSSLTTGPLQCPLRPSYLGPQEAHSPSDCKAPWSGLPWPSAVRGNQMGRGGSLLWTRSEPGEAAA